MNYDPTQIHYKPNVGHDITTDENYSEFFKPLKLPYTFNARKNILYDAAGIVLLPIGWLVFVWFLALAPEERTLERFLQIFFGWSLFAALLAFYGYHAAIQPSVPYKLKFTEKGLDLFFIRKKLFVHYVEIRSIECIYTKKRVAANSVMSTVQPDLHIYFSNMNKKAIVLQFDRLVQGGTRPEELFWSLKYLLKDKGVAFKVGELDLFTNT